MQSHEMFMQRCLELAANGAGQVSPNPLVGCVITFNGKIAAEGYHAKFGAAHAEVEAIRNLPAHIPINECTLYVNLEPCAHHGKTPPCADLIIEKGFKKVVAGMKDPNPLVAGKGFDKLRAAGIEVIENCLEEKCLFLNRRFITFQTQKRPYIILKWAQTSDGFIAPLFEKGNEAQYEKDRHITGLIIQKLVHKWRTFEDAILVGSRTALLDNPKLNSRAWFGHSPKRIIIDRDLQLPRHLSVFDASVETYFFNVIKNDKIDKTHWVKLNDTEYFLEEMIAYLYSINIQSLIIEGGSILLHKIIEKGLWDEAIIFTSPKQLTNGIISPKVSGRKIQKEEIDGVQMLVYAKN